MTIKSLCPSFWQKNDAFKILEGDCKKILEKNLTHAHGAHSSNSPFPDEWKKADELDAELIQLFEDKRKAHREKKRARESGTQVAEEAAPPAQAARVKEEPKPKPDQPKSAEELKAAVVRVKNRFSPEQRVSGHALRVFMSA